MFPPQMLQKTLLKPASETAKRATMVARVFSNERIEVNARCRTGIDRRGLFFNGGGIVQLPVLQLPEYFDGRLGVLGTDVFH